MSIKLKALGLGLLAAMAMGAVAVLNASATTTGHFGNTATGGHALVVGTESGTHRLKFSIDGGTPIECEEASYHGTVASAAVNSVRVTPTYGKCKTEGGSAGSVVVDTNECHFVFHSNTKASGSKPSGHATVTVECTDKGPLVITHPNCEIRIPSQSLTGVTYTPNGSEITLDATVGGVAAQYESGICVFLGTSHTGAMNGSVTVKGTNTDGSAASISAT